MIQFLKFKSHRNKLLKFKLSLVHVLSFSIHCVESVQLRRFYSSVFRPNKGKYGPEKIPYLDTFHAVTTIPSKQITSQSQQ